MTGKIRLPPNEMSRNDLAPDLADAFGQMSDSKESPETLREGLAIVNDVLDEEEIDVGIRDMYQDEQTRHAVSVDENTEYVPCVMDAMIVALSLDIKPIEVRSDPPREGKSVKFSVTHDQVKFTPENAVVSFGVVHEGTQEFATIEKELNEPATIPLTCSLINAFPDSSAYERWAGEISGAGVMDLTVEDFVALSYQSSRSNSIGSFE